MTWAQLGRHRKPIALVNIDGFWNPMLALLDHMRAEGFVHTGHLVKPLVVDAAEAVVPAVTAQAAAFAEAAAEGDTRVIGRL
jgi:predicted Rossmann-fold nucleotide-binding protein